MSTFFTRSPDQVKPQYNAEKGGLSVDKTLFKAEQFMRKTIQFLDKFSSQTSNQKPNRIANEALHIALHEAQNQLQIANDLQPEVNKEAQNTPQYNK